MARRDLLHFSKLQEFLSWCDEKCIPTRKPTGDYQVAQVYNRKTKRWGCIYKKLYATEHFTTDISCTPVVEMYIKEKRNGKS